MTPEEWDELIALNDLDYICAELAAACHRAALRFHATGDTPLGKCWEEDSQAFYALANQVV